MLEKSLVSCGLSEKEVKAYLALLQLGTRPISRVASKAGLNRGTAYVVLHSLLEKGLVTKTIKRGVYNFSALDPKHLTDYASGRVEQAQRASEEVSRIIGQLQALVNPLTTQPKIEFFDGKEGARKVLNFTLEAKEKTLRAFLSIADISDTVGIEFFDQYTLHRIERGFQLNAIRATEKDNDAFLRYAQARRYISSKKDRRAIRYAPKGMVFPISMYLYDDKVAILASKTENFSLIIQSRELAEMQKQLFELLWASLSDKAQGKNTGKKE